MYTVCISETLWRGGKDRGKGITRLKCAETFPMDNCQPWSLFLEEAETILKIVIIIANSFSDFHFWSLSRKKKLVGGISGKIQVPIKTLRSILRSYVMKEEKQFPQGFL